MYILIKLECFLNKIMHFLKKTRKLLNIQCSYRYNANIQIQGGITHGKEKSKN